MYLYAEQEAVYAYAEQEDVWTVEVRTLKARIVEAQMVGASSESVNSGGMGRGSTIRGRGRASTRTGSASRVIPCDEEEDTDTVHELLSVSSTKRVVCC